MKPTPASAAGPPLPTAMCAARCTNGEIRCLDDAPLPDLPRNWAMVRVAFAGICGTDLELVKGYKEFSGIPGHEFSGYVVRHPDPAWLGRRVSGEINVGCGRCDLCRAGLQRHCPQRQTLGINALNGCMAEYCCLPAENLVELPDDLPMPHGALLEPLAAAAEIPAQITVRSSDRVLVLGDGPLGLLCAWVLATRTPHVQLLGHHSPKLEQARWRTIAADLGRADTPAAGADIVVEATGNHTGLGDAIRHCRPRGTVVLKSTVADPAPIDLAPVVVNEISIVGSRCGRFADALALLEQARDLPLHGLISDTVPLARLTAAFARARDPNTLKVLIHMPETARP